MTTAAPGFLVRFAVGVYQLILRAYPPAFRERCGAPMVQTFEQQCAARFHEGPGTAVRLCAGEYASAIAGIWRSRTARPPRASAARRTGTMAQDVRFAVRRLRAQPAIVLLTTVTLGFAIAATTSMFSIVDAIMLRPSPFAEPERLMSLYNHSIRTGRIYPGLTRDKLKTWRAETEIFDAVEAYRRTSVVVTGGVEPEELPAAYVSPGVFTALGLAPKAGRLFAPTEGGRGDSDLVIVGEGYWRTRLGGDANAIGRRLAVNGRQHTVIGVMPERFTFPTSREQVWLPFDPEERGAADATIEILARLSAGLTRETVRARVAAAVARLDAERPLPSGWGIALRPSTVSGPDEATRRGVLVLFGAVALVLLTASANVANLLLSRAVDRHREFAIRLVLGASRGRVFRELLAEGMLLGLLAGAVGLVAANWALQVLVGLAPAGLMPVTTSTIAVDARVFAFTAAVAIITGILCNLAPAVRALRVTGNDAISGRTRSATETPTQRRLRAGLVIAEVALAVVLLVGAALMVRSFIKLNAIDIGFDPDHLLAVTIGLDTERYKTEPDRVAFLRHLASDVAQLHGVSGVAIASGVPPAPGTVGLANPETDSGPCVTDSIQVFASVVSPSYFSLMGMTLHDGRPFREGDPGTAVVLSRALASQCGGDSLVGRRLRLGPAAPWLQVVGIAGDVKTKGLVAEGGELAFYLPLDADLDAAIPMTAMMIERRVAPRRLVIRAEQQAVVIDGVKRALWARDPDQPILSAAPAADLMAETIRRERFMLTLMTLFSAVTLVLASAGIFGVLAYTVSQRTNEIGIRLALGASLGNVRRLVVGQGMGLVIGGVTLGMIGAFALSRLMRGLLYDVDVRDPLAFVLVPGLVCLVGVLASWIPTARALRVDPASALRVE